VTALLLLAASTWGVGTVNYDGWPPRRYTSDNTALVHFVAPDKIDGACGVKHDPVNPEEACQEGAVIVLPNPCTFPERETFARLACHELGHRNGWPGNHPK
jgi:hypothetical protein